MITQKLIDRINQLLARASTRQLALIHRIVQAIIQ